MVNPADVSDRYAIVGFITGFVGFLIFPILISIKGYQSEKYRIFAVMGIIISFIEIIALVVLGVIFYS